jgi:hypothetical protein
MPTQWRPGKLVPAVQIDSDGDAYVTNAAGNRLYLSAGDWIVPDGDGGHWVCKERVI